MAVSGLFADALRHLANHAWADFGSNVNVDDAPLEVWVERILRGESIERAGREYHPRSGAEC